MNEQRYFAGLLFCALTLCFACKTDVSNQTQTSLPTEHNCTVKGKSLPDNSLWLRNTETLVSIIADASTQDVAMGSLHRKLVITDTRDCSTVEEIMLPIIERERSAYRLAQNNYNNSSQQVGIIGDEEVYVYDAANRRLLDPLVPQFTSKTISGDAQVGTILHLELWEYYLIGYAADKGTFVYDLRKAGTPQQVVPRARYALSDGRSSSLFLLSSEGKPDRFQAILPNYDASANQFNINPLMSVPALFANAPTDMVSDTRYAILQQIDEQGNTSPIAVDMLERSRVSLPADVTGLEGGDLLEWLQNRK